MKKATSANSPSSTTLLPSDISCLNHYISLTPACLLFFATLYPLSCWDIQSRLECPALTYFSNRDRKTFGSEIGVVLRIPQNLYTSVWPWWRQEILRRSPPSCLNKLVLDILIWTECLNSWRDTVSSGAEALRLLAPSPFFSSSIFLSLFSVLAFPLPFPWN